MVPRGFQGHRKNTYLRMVVIMTMKSRYHFQKKKRGQLFWTIILDHFAERLRRMKVEPRLLDLAMEVLSGLDKRRFSNRRG